MIQTLLEILLKMEISILIGIQNDEQNQENDPIDRWNENGLSALIQEIIKVSRFQILSQRQNLILNPFSTSKSVFSLHLSHFSC